MVGRRNLLDEMSRSLGTDATAIIIRDKSSRPLLHMACDPGSRCRQASRGGPRREQLSSDSLPSRQPSSGRRIINRGIRQLLSTSEDKKSSKSTSEAQVLECWLIPVGQEFRYAGRVLSWWCRCGHRLALAWLRGQPVSLRGLGELERLSERLRRRFLQVGRGQRTCCSWKAPVLRFRSTSSKPVKLPTLTTK
jgi:hypothetical protein